MTTSTKLVYAVVVATLGCGVVGCEDHEAEWKRQEREAWEGPCHDESWLLATTAGSPNRFRCSNRDHRMRVQVATHPSNEEAAALVFCECARSNGDAR